MASMAAPTWPLFSNELNALETAARGYELGVPDARILERCVRFDSAKTFQPALRFFSEVLEHYFCLARTPTFYLGM
jgi:hypothetical protein